MFLMFLHCYSLNLASSESDKKIKSLYNEHNRDFQKVKLKKEALSINIILWTKQKQFVQYMVYAKKETQVKIPCIMLNFF